jgi:hypothetical protein
MARTKPAAVPAAAEEIDDDRMYWVELARKVDRGNGIFLLPGQKTKLRGRVLKEIQADVASYSAVEA